MRYHVPMSANQTNLHNGGLRGLLDTLWRIHTRDRGAVLGVVVATEGSTYQKPGALVLLDDTGVRHGVISGGCLEPALEDAAREVHASGKAVSVEFDTRSDEDLLFGSGTGCRGRVKLLLLPLPPRGVLARALFSILERGVALEMSLVGEGESVGAGFATFGEDEDERLRFSWDARGNAVAAIGAATLQVRVAPPAQLLLLGAGPETTPLAEFARRLGWFVTVVEHRGRWAAFARSAQPERLIELPPEAAAKEVARERPDAAIVMSHNFAVDLTWLRYCAESDIGYVGLLGPGTRRDALLAELDEAQRARLKSRLHAPVGLDLGGHGGEVVALAIAAELQRQFARAASSVAAVRPIAERV